ncbi:MAG TPA: hypothetical protein VGD14_05175 [bacterium]
MMGKREIAMVDGDEVDGLTRSKRYHLFKPGERKRLKRKFNKRVRQYAKQKYPLTKHLQSMPDFAQIEGAELIE